MTENLRISHNKVPVHSSIVIPRNMHCTAIPFAQQMDNPHSNPEISLQVSIKPKKSMLCMLALASSPSFLPTP